MIVCFSFLTFLDFRTRGKCNGMSGVKKRYISGKKIPHARVSLNAEKSTEISASDRYIGDISPIFFDFSTERFLIAKIVSLGSDIRYIADISADISKISNTARRYIT